MSIFRYLGPNSPWGVGPAALATVGVLFGAILVFGPPITLALRWWWGLFL